DFLRFTQLLQHALARDGPARHAKVLVALFKIYRIEEPAAAAPVIGTATDVSEAGSLNRPLLNAVVLPLVAVFGLLGVRTVAARPPATRRYCRARPLLSRRLDRRDRCRRCRRRTSAQ